MTIDDRRTNDRRAIVTVMVLLAGAAAPRLAAAAGAADATAAAPRNAADGARIRADRWQASLGVRGALFRDAGYDPFAANDAFVQTSFAVTCALRTGATLIPALGLAVDRGNADDVARGVDAHLGLTRLAMLIEQRGMLRSGFYLAGRLAPGVLRASATLRDSSAPAPLQTTYTSLSIDASVGAGARLNSAAAPLGLWVVGDAGYGWTQRRRLALSPALPAADAPKAGEIPLGALAARGPFVRIALALTY